VLVDDDDGVEEAMVMGREVVAVKPTSVENRIPLILVVVGSGCVVLLVLVWPVVVVSRALESDVDARWIGLEVDLLVEVSGSSSSFDAVLVATVVVVIVCVDDDCFVVVGFVLVEGRGAWLVRGPGLSYLFAHSFKLIPSGQHHVAPCASAEQK
jgi:hypothetical protein